MSDEKTFVTISRGALDRLCDLIIDLLKENEKLKKKPPQSEGL